MVSLMKIRPLICVVDQLSLIELPRRYDRQTDLCYSKALHEALSLNGLVRLAIRIILHLGVKEASLSQVTWPER